MGTTTRKERTAYTEVQLSSDKAIMPSCVNPVRRVGDIL